MRNPLYLSPEAIQAPDTVDARSDLYALGALAWFSLVGHPPFEANSIIEVCGQLEACELAGRWTADRALEWWRTHAANAPTSEPPSATGQTLALDVSARAAPAAR
ncbi:MAG: hypothetical protein ABI895_38655 [Deltaproteobacteria bacterium]